MTLATSAAAGSHSRAAPGASRRSGFTLVELLVVVFVLACLALLATVGGERVRRRAQSTQSAGNLHALVAANLLYAADHGGRFCPAQDRRNLRRWHGGRTSTRAAFDPAQGFLYPYLADGGKARVCGVFMACEQSPATFERGSGGYGYNAAYIGGTPESAFVPEREERVRSLSRTIMFADTALPRANGLQEYPFCEPYRAVNPDGSLGGKLTPSVHFRHDGYAHIAWCDGAVTAEPPARLGGVNLYGGDAMQYQIGWVGPEADNGWWNARREEAARR